MILIVATMIYIVFTKIGSILKHLKYVWVNCYIITIIFLGSPYGKITIISGYAPKGGVKITSSHFTPHFFYLNLHVIRPPKDGGVNT